MVSEKLLNYRAGIVLLVFNIISFTGAGIMIATGHYLSASLFAIAGSDNHTAACQDLQRYKRDNYLLL